MTALRFNWVKKYMKNSFELHRKMVEMALQEGVSKAARAFGTTRKERCRGACAHSAGS